MLTFGSPRCRASTCACISVCIMKCMRTKEPLVVDSRYSLRSYISRLFLRRPDQGVSPSFPTWSIINTPLVFLLQLGVPFALFLMSVSLSLLFFRIFFRLRSSMMRSLLFLRSWIIVLMRRVSEVLLGDFSLG